MRIVGLLASLLLVGTAFAQTKPSTKPMTKAPGELTFAAYNDRYQAEGRFDSWRFTRVDIPDGDLSKATVELEVDMTSVWEKAAKLAAHLRTADFFDVETYPKATVTISGAKKNEDGSYEATAKVSLHGKSGEMPVIFKVKNKDPLEVEGTAVLSRATFGIGEGPDSGSKIVDGIKIRLSAKLDG